MVVHFDTLFKNTFVLSYHRNDKQGFGILI